jgi:hypothetical protein
MLPSDNINSLRDKLKCFGASRMFLECNTSFLPHLKELKTLKVPVRYVKEFTKEDNRVITEAGFICDHFVFDKNADTTYYTSFMQKLNVYTTTSDPNESNSANAVSGMAYVVKVLFKQLLK